ncbi:MAG: alpha/beta hydrolase [Deltaproteobacteria bacterium]|nr:alpha/beta hydrolase [Deltaproteobacteria bacterium]
MVRENGYVKSGSGRLEVRWYGPDPGEATTLVFLHEGLGCAAMWRDFPSDLAAATGCGALVYSRLGYGRSDACDLPRPLRFMHHEGQTVLPELLEKTGVRDCILIGHSDGGSIAIIHAGNGPEVRLRGLVTMAAHVFCESLTIQSIQAARKNYLEGDLREKLKKYHGRNVDCAFWGWNDAWLHPDFKKWNIEAFLPGINAPLLAIQGKEDPYGTPAQVEAIVGQAGGPADPLMLDACGHAPHRDRPNATLRAMSNFIRKIKA